MNNEYFRYLTPTCSGSRGKDNELEVTVIESHIVCVESENDSENSEVESDSNETKFSQKPKKKKYDVKYNRNWEQEFSMWLIKSSIGKAFCKVCQKQMEGGRKHLSRHSETKIHQKNMEKMKGSQVIKQAILKSKTSQNEYLVKEAELKLLMFIVEHNLPFSTMAHLPQMIKSLCPNSPVVSSLKCSRTKTSELLKRIVCPYAQKQLADNLKNVYFSIIIDETTDITTKKCLVIVTRFYDEELKKIKDYVLGLLELDVATSKSIFESICNLFNRLNIPINRMIGFASDNASVMMGDLNGVKTKFKEILPGLFVMRCMSHSLHLCASKACAKLPEGAERLAKDIYNYFSHSSKRKKEFEQFQEFANVQPHTLLRPCQTRWLSLYSVVQRIIEQWPALILFFQSEALESNIAEAILIMNGLQNPILELYFLFLSRILAIVTKMNIEFQSEVPQIHKLMTNVTANYKMILKLYLKNNIVNNTPLHILEPSNPHYFLDLEEIHFGHAVEDFLEKNDVPREDLKQFRLRCLDFYVVLAREIKSRVDFNDKFLTDLDIINPTKIFNDEKKSIYAISQRFSHLFNDSQLEDIYLEWRMISEVKPDREILCIEDLILYLSKQTNACGDLLFEKLNKLLKIIATLPHSSAAAERLFSTLSLIKTKYRNALSVETCNALLLSKQILKNKECFNWCPPEELVKSVQRLNYIDM